MDILSALRKVTTSIKTWVDGKLDTKLDKNLGEDNTGKILVVNDTGDVEFQDQVQSNWNENDESSLAYVKNRTHYDSRKTETVTLTFDGNLDGKQTILVNDSGTYLVKISNEPIPMADMIGAQISVYENGETSYISVQEDDISFPSEQIYRVGGGSVFVALEDTELEGFSITRGVWVICIKENQDYEAYTASLSYDIATGELKKLDEKYIPDSVYNGIKSAKTTADSKMDKNNPTGTGSFSLNRKSGTTVGSSSFACGSGNTASGSWSHAEGFNTTASGSASHAEGNGTTASGNYSHAEGQSTKASKTYSHAEGLSTTASGSASHAEGNGTTASGSWSHAEGYQTTAGNTSSHAEGQSTSALHPNSHTEGYGTTSTNDCSHVQGKYNILGNASSQYAHIIGNGTSASARSNAHTVDWSGNAWYSGDVYVGSTSGTNKDEGSKKLATEEYVSTALGNYTPDSSLGITGAIVGQIAKITAVDSDGKPTEWGVTDVPSDDHINSLINTALGVIENGTY